MSNERTVLSNTSLLSDQDNYAGGRLFADGLADGIIAHGGKQIQEDPGGAALSITGGVAFGLAFSVMPRWITAPAGMLAGVSMLKLGERAVTGSAHSIQAISSLSPAEARKVVANELGPVAVEGLYMAATAALTGGLLCKPSLKRISETWKRKPEDLDQTWERRLPGGIEDNRNLPPPPVPPESILRTDTTFTLADPASLFPAVSQRGLKEALQHPFVRTKFKPVSLEMMFTVPGCDRANIEAVALKHLTVEPGSDQVILPLMSRQFRQVMLSRRPTSDPLSQLYNNVRDSVVRINAYDGTKLEGWTGSGFFVSSDGLIATALHTAYDATRLTVRTSNGTVLPARLVGHDLKADLGILKIDAEPGTFKPLPLARTPLTDGDKIFVFGHPAGNPNMFVSPGMFNRIEPSVTAIKPAGSSKVLWQSPVFPEFSCLAYTRPGNSGGPIVNSRGEVEAVFAAGKFNMDCHVSYGAPATLLFDLISNLPAEFPSSHRVFRLKDYVLPLSTEIVEPRSTGGSMVALQSLVADAAKLCKRPS